MSGLSCGGPWAGASELQLSRPPFLHGMVGMTRFWRKAPRVLLLFVLATPVAAQTPAASTSAAKAAQPIRQAHQTSGRKRAKSKPSPVPAPQPQPPPPAPLTPEQMPPVPPQVTYSNGLLTIVATNSTLSDILHAVSARTGATLDAPPHLIGERVAARLGPATPREVLSELLSSPRFDYILVGADGDPNAVRSIILTANQASPTSTSVAMAQPQPTPMPAEEADEEEDQVAPQSEGVPPGRFAQQPSPGRRQFVQPQPPDQMAQPAPSGEAGNQHKAWTLAA